MPTVFAVQEMPNVRRMRRKLQNFGDKDFLLLAGDPVAIGMACAIVAFYNAGRYSVLKWDRREKLYIPIQIDVTTKGESDE